MKKTLIFSTALLLPVITLFLVTEWKIDPGTKTNFSVKGTLGATVTGTMDISSSSIKFDANDLKHSSIAASVNVKTISTGINMRDNHLKSSDYFEADTYPTISFVSSSIEKINDNSFIAKGKLTIKKTTKAVNIPFIFKQDGKTALFSGTFDIKRTDYGIGKTSAMMGNTVTVNLKIPTKQ